MITVNARILAPPKISFKQGSINTRAGMWNFGNHKFIKPATVPSWVLLYVRASAGPNKGSLTTEELQAFATFAQTQVKLYGVTMPKCLGVQTINIPDVTSFNRDEIDKAIKTKFLSSNPPALVWVIIPTRDIFLKARIKLYGDVIAGTQTMLLQEQHVKTKSLDTLGNEAAKMNLRFGGTCWSLDQQSLKPLDKTYMVSKSSFVAGNRR